MAELARHSPNRPPPRQFRVRASHPAVGLLADFGKSGLTVSEQQRREIHAGGCQQVEGHVCRTAMPEQAFDEERAPGVAEHYEFAVEHKANSS